MTPRVSAVLLGWNGREDTLACLRSLGRATYPALSVVVVDNGSTDGGPDAVAAEFPASACSAGENRGFAGGVNVGVDAALGDGAEAVLLLNNDATAEPGFLEPLVEAARRGCRRRLRPDPRQRNRSHLVRGRELRPAAWPPGSAHGLRRPAAPGGDRAVRDRAGLRRRDADFPCRARRRRPARRGALRVRRGCRLVPARLAAGFRILVVPASVVHHRVSASTGGASSPDSLYYALRNGLLVAERNAAGRLGSLSRLAEAAAAFTAQALRSPRRVDGLRAVGDGLRDARRGRLGARGA